MESNKYGHFWKCPNGETCKYKHSLPPGYVLNPKKKATEEVDDDEEETPLEEIIEAERAKMIAAGKAVTPCTLENFNAWKERKKLAREAELAEMKKEEKKRPGLAVLSGRDLFTYDPSLFIDDEGADDEAYVVHDEDQEEEKLASIEEALYDFEHQDEIEVDANIESNAKISNVFLEDVELPSDSDENLDEKEEDEDEDDSEEEEKTA